MGYDTLLSRIECAGERETIPFFEEKPWNFSGWRIQSYLRMAGTVSGIFRLLKTAETKKENIDK